MTANDDATTTKKALTMRANVSVIDALTDDAAQTQGTTGTAPRPGPRAPPRPPASPGATAARASPSRPDSRRRCQRTRSPPCADCAASPLAPQARQRRTVSAAAQADRLAPGVSKIGGPPGLTPAPLSQLTPLV